MIEPCLRGLFLSREDRCGGVGIVSFVWFLPVGFKDSFLIFVSLRLRICLLSNHVFEVS